MSWDRETTKRYVKSIGGPFDTNEKVILYIERLGNPTEIINLYLTDRGVTTLEVGVFDRLKNLKGLYLGWNELTSLPSGLFDRLENLKELYLEGNQLTSLPPKILKRKNIILRFNELEEEMERNRVELEKRMKVYEKKFFYVRGEIECFTPQPKNYDHLPVFRTTYLGQTGGVGFLRGMEILDEI